MKNIDSIKASAMSRFLSLCQTVGGLASAQLENLEVYDNSTEEIVDAAAGGRAISLFARGSRILRGNRGAKKRLEENYLFDTRRFPTFVAGEAFPVTIAAGDYLFFQNAVGQPAVNNGFGTAVTVMTELETNMDVAGQIAQGKNFVFNRIGVSFNSDISTVDCGILMESGALRFEKQGGQYTLRHGPIRHWPGGTGISGYSATSAAVTTIAAAHNGDSDIRATRQLAIPRVIKEKESFAYKYVVPRSIRNISPAAGSNAQLGAACLMTIWLWGGQQDDLPV